MRGYRLYVALGDSILSDDYPGPGHGAAALLGRAVGVETINLTRTGYTIRDVLDSLARLKPHPGPVLVVLTVGGNDLLLAASEGTPLPGVLQSLQTGLGEVRRRLAELFPDHDLLIGNLYDPTEGTGRVQSDAWRGGPPRPQLVAALNEVNRVLAAAGGRLVDLHQLFEGRAKDWVMRDIEPNREGALAISQRFRDALE